MGEEQGSDEGMKKEKIAECIQLTDDILMRHFRGDHRLVMEHLHENCLWIGSNTIEYYQGRTMILQQLEKEKTALPQISLSSKEFQCISHDRNSCVIAGRYIGITDEESKEIYRDMQRVTFTWKEEKGYLYLTHMHVSNPLTNVERDEIFPHGVGRFTRKYVDMLIKKEVERSGHLMIKDRDNVTHKIQTSNILYLEAFNVNTLIHALDGDIFARGSITELERQISELQEDMFVRVHKSFCVNRFYVTSIKAFELCLADQFIVPVSKAKYTEVKAHLHM